MRLPRSHSMRRRADFARVRAAGAAKAGRLLVVSTLADPSLPGLRVGVITTRKVGKAHARNLLRRRLRAIVQRHGDKISDLRRFVVMIPRHGAAAADFDQLERDWLKQARRLGILAPGETETR